VHHGAPLNMLSMQEAMHEPHTLITTIQTQVNLQHQLLAAQTTIARQDDLLARVGATLMKGAGMPLVSAIMAIPYTGLSFAASCNSRSSHDQYTRSSTEHFEYGAVTSARLLG
jgi:hypothetical protein